MKRSELNSISRSEGNFLDNLLILAVFLSQQLTTVVDTFLFVRRTELYASGFCSSPIRSSHLPAKTGVSTN
jgi:hypothetical protein